MKCLCECKFKHSRVSNKNKLCLCLSNNAYTDKQEEIQLPAQIVIGSIFVFFVPSWFICFDIYLFVSAVDLFS